MLGRKIDLRDAEWVELLRRGLLRASFIRAHSERELPGLTPAAGPLQCGNG